MGSFNYDNTKMIFIDEFIADQSQIRSVLDYSVQIRKLPVPHQNYEALTGNYSVAGFELTLKRKISHYIITCECFFLLTETVYAKQKLLLSYD